MPEIKPVTHVIFDFDGLLVDTEPAYTEANARALAPHGVQFTMEIKAEMMGRKQMESIKWLLEKVGIADKVTPDDYNQVYAALLDELFRNAPAKEGAERLVRHLAKHNIPLAICSGSSSLCFPPKAEQHRSWVDLVPVKVLTGDDPAVKRGKPAPDGYLETLKRLPSPPSCASSILVFEDAPNGVHSALAAGMQCVQVPTGPHPAFRMDAETAAKITVIDSLLDFDPRPFGLPAFD